MPFDIFGTMGPALSLRTVVLACLTTLLLSQAIAAVYIWTFRGLSYTRSYLQTIVTASVVACMLMLVMNNNLAAGLGIAGSLAFVRFRTSMRDPRDMAFVFAALGAGIAAGLRAFEIAVVGTALFCLANVLFVYLDVGRRHLFDGLLRFAARSDADVQLQVSETLRYGTQRFALVTLREIHQGQGLDHAYQVRIRRLEDKIGLVHALQAIPGVEDVTFHLQDETTEI